MRQFLRIIHQEDRGDPAGFVQVDGDDTDHRVPRHTRAPASPLISAISTRAPAAPFLETPARKRAARSLPRLAAGPKAPCRRHLKRPRHPGSASRQGGKHLRSHRRRGTAGASAGGDRDPRRSADGVPAGACGRGSPAGGVGFTGLERRGDLALSGVEDLAQQKGHALGRREDSSTCRRRATATPPSRRAASRAARPMAPGSHGPT